MKHRIALIVSAPMTAKVFLRNIIIKLSQQYEVTLFANDPGLNQIGDLKKYVTYNHLPVMRNITPLRDLVCVWRAFRCFRHESYDLIHSITPKSGLVSMLAGKMAGVNIRVHTFTGQVWATKKGVRKFILKFVDKIITYMATIVYVDSPSQKEFLVRENVVRAEEALVMAYGSISGVDVNKFKPRPEIRNQVRRELNISNDLPIALYLGRIKREKGIIELIYAFKEILDSGERCGLVLVGPDEDGIRDEINGILGKEIHAIRFVNYTEQPERFFNSADIFCLPSHREGFGSVIIEAAACGLPSVASRIYGITDAVVDGSTGVLHEPGNVTQIKNAILCLFKNEELRRRMGDAARKRAIGQFSESRLTEAWLGAYKNLLYNAEHDTRSST